MIRSSVLNNGVRIISESIPNAHSVSLGVWVQNGSRHELTAENGVSHFLEHMLFKGTSRRSAQEIARQIDSVGGQLNAFTSREYSCYYAKVLARRLPLAIDLLADVVQNPLFDLDELEKERRVILQEICMVEDNPDDAIHDLFSQTFWGGDPLGAPILGTTSTVGEFDRNQLLDFMRRRYVGQRLVVSAAGDLRHEDLAREMASSFAGMVASGDRPDLARPQPRRHIAITYKDLEQVHLCLGTCALPQDHPDRFALYLLNTILGGSMSSRLFQTVREERGLAYSIYSYLHCHSDAGALVVYAGCAPDDAQEVVALILREMRRLRREPVSGDELGAAREQLRGNLLLSLESTENRMTRLAKNELYLGRQLAVSEVLAGFDKVQVEDIRRLAGAILKDEYLNLHLLGRVEPADFPGLDLTLG